MGKNFPAVPPRRIFEEGELKPEATVKKYLSVLREGRRNVKGMLDFYSLDMIISVGYRIAAWRPLMVMFHRFQFVNNEQRQ